MNSLALPAFLVVAAFTLLAQSQVPSSAEPCRIVDVAKTNRGHDYYVDGKRVGTDVEVNLLELLRRSEASSSSSCLKLFVPTSVRLNAIEDGRVVAGKMQYEEFHAYVYDERRDWVNEILWQALPSANLRAGMKGTVDWPSSDSARK